MEESKNEHRALNYYVFGVIPMQINIREYYHCLFVLCTSKLVPQSMVFFKGAQRLSDGGGVGRALHQIFGRGVQHAMKKWTQRDLSFVKMRGQNDLRTVEKGVNKIENQGENWSKMLQNGQMTDFEN